MRLQSLQPTIFASLLLPLALAACAQPAATPDLTFDQRMRNPLFAERYWDEMADRMANLQISKDPLMENADKAAIADRARQSAIELSQLSRQKRLEGIFGGFVTVNEATEGYALLVDRTLYLSTTFTTYPGPSLYLFLSPDVDPRESDFPNDNTLALGALQSPYGAQSYTLPALKEGEEDPGYRTVVLWDTKLERLYGFAQLSK